ncbi:hypothetical protein BC835DRAFT_1080317 [Cytidiella melzeri]|nr:hypothetical protein BC835DRAFT_1080317 [Cytidiella melzeri]
MRRFATNTHYSRRSSFGALQGPTSCPQLYQWLIVSHIYRRWRHAAMANPRMWATIQLISNTDCVSAMLKRSGQVPLTSFEDVFRRTTDNIPKLTLIRPFLRPTIVRLNIDSVRPPISVDTCLDILAALLMLEILNFQDVRTFKPLIFPSIDTRLPIPNCIVSLSRLHRSSLQVRSLWYPRLVRDLSRD